MTEPQYVAIAGSLARAIRTGELRPGARLPSYADIAERHGVSDIVIRHAIKLLISQGLVRTIERRGTFVTARPDLTRVAPERQLESPETTFGNESGRDVVIERDTARLAATAELAEALEIAVGATVSHVVTRASEDGRAVSISDSYQPAGISGVDGAAFLEETIADRLPTPAHAAWLGTPAGDLVKTVHQRFLGGDDRVIMVSDISYPQDRYDAFVFRMPIGPA
ncbi:GntR family transcriptional regulator [Nocardia sp. NPDC005978]|uniref:GntR family transcriptional regulator n=1 Tax=Nocardia sp. NPDC005978 TaxID=3156725 RepID=UPI0033A62C01